MAPRRGGGRHEGSLPSSAKTTINTTAAQREAGLPGFAVSERPCRIGVPQRGPLFGDQGRVLGDELAQLRRFPEPARAELIKYFTLGPADETFARKFRERSSLGPGVRGGSRGDKGLEGRPWHVGPWGPWSLAGWLPCLA